MTIEIFNLATVFINFMLVISATFIFRAFLEELGREDSHAK